MTDDHDTLRSALLDLADVPPPPFLATAALGRARRHHRRRLATGITATAGALAAAVLVLPAVSGRAGPETAAGAPPPPSAYVYAYAVGSRSSIYDPATESYRPTSYSMPGRSPDGRSWVVPDPGNSLRYGVVGRADLLAGRPPARWLLTSHDGPRWSPDSTRLLYSDQAGRTWSVDVRTGGRTQVRLRGLGDLTGRVDRVDWGPDGGYLAEALPTERETRGPDGVVHVNPSGTVRIAVTDAAGTVRSRAEVPTRMGPARLSPDGTRFLTYGAVQDRATGRSIRFDGVPAGWLDGHHLIVWEEAASRLRVLDVRTGATTSVKAVPKTVQEPEIAVVDGDPPAGAIVV